MTENEQKIADSCFAEGYVSGLAYGVVKDFGPKSVPREFAERCAQAQAHLYKVMEQAGDSCYELPVNELLAILRGEK